MRRTSLSQLFKISVTGFAVFGVASNAQQPVQDPFLGHGERGELVHVLPPPAAVQAQPDVQSATAPAHSGATVYKASYGSGNLIYHGGGTVMISPAFYAIYWNSNVANALGSQGYTNSTISAEISAFIGTFLTGDKYPGSASDDFTIVGQYRDSAGHDPVPTAAPSMLGSFFDSQTGSSISDSQIQQYLANLFGNSGVAAQSNAIYGVYFPAGVTVTLGSSASCSSFCGYHSSFNYGGVIVKYAVFPFPNCSGCSISGLLPGDMLTIVSSHEIREAVTDPLGNAWFDRRGYEADDKCVWHNLYQLKNRPTGLSFWVQPEYSNGGTVTNPVTSAAATYPGPGCVVP